MPYPQYPCKRVGDGVYTYRGYVIHLDHECSARSREKWRVVEGPLHKSCRELLSLAVRYAAPAKVCCKSWIDNHVEVK